MLLLAVFLFGLDRYLKNLALSNFSQNIVGEWLRFEFVPNYGIAFSLPLGGAWMNLLILLIICLMLARIMHLLISSDKSSEAGLLMTATIGAISNLYDRVMYGYVVDYVDLAYFTVFNLADAMIVASLCVIMYLGVRVDKN